jgi:hypothetical protein
MYDEYIIPITIASINDGLEGIVQSKFLNSTVKDVIYYHFLNLYGEAKTTELMNDF